MPFLSYAANFEDVMLWRALGHVREGFYVDVGAYPSAVDGVTRAFYDRGWRGINIDPVADRIAEIAERRPRDVNLGVAASDGDGRTPLYLVTGTGLATVEEAVARRHGEGWNVATLDVPRRRLSALLDEHVAPGQPIHFLKIDVEGHETAAVRGMDFSRHRPWVILIGATAPRSSTEIDSYWERLLGAAGYQSVYWDGLNRFYLAEEHSRLQPAFATPPNVFDDFIRAEADGEFAELERENLFLRQLLDKERAKSAAVRSADAAHAAELERGLDNLRASVEWHSRQVSLAEAATERALAQLRYVNDRPFWESLLFRPSGRPRKVLRRLVFHASGKPRGLFRSVLFRPDGRPHKPFRQWMSSDEYQALRGAVRPPPVVVTSPEPEPEAPVAVAVAVAEFEPVPEAVAVPPALMLSPAADRLANRLAAHRSIRSQ